MSGEVTKKMEANAKVHQTKSTPLLTDDLTQFYAEKRRQALAWAELQKEALIRNSREARTIESRRVEAGVRLCLASLESDAALLQEKRRQARDDLRAAEEELGQWFLRQGYPAAGPEARWQCPICHDRAILPDRSPCPCTVRSREELYGRELPFRAPTAFRFSEFDLSLFSDERREAWYGGRFSPREAGRALRRQAENYVDEFSAESGNLYLFGSPGCGKSFLAACMANALEEKGALTAFLSASRYFDLRRRLRVLENSFRADEEELDELRRHLKYLSAAAVLVLDDLGSEPYGDGSYHELIRLLDEREQTKRPLILTGNLSPMDFSRSYDERVGSRLAGNFLLLPVSGPDLRLTRALRRKETIG